MIGNNGVEIADFGDSDRFSEPVSRAPYGQFTVAVKVDGAKRGRAMLDHQVIPTTIMLCHKGPIRICKTISKHAFLTSVESSRCILRSSLPSWMPRPVARYSDSEYSRL